MVYSTANLPPVCVLLGFLLFVGGLALLWVLSGIALFAVVASAIVNVLYITIFGLLNRYYPHLTKVMY